MAPIIRRGKIRAQVSSVPRFSLCLNFFRRQNWGNPWFHHRRNHQQRRHRRRRVPIWSLMHDVTRMDLSYVVFRLLAVVLSAYKS
ncbi:hypothetical protein HanXRQr2_Chr01g0014331 [Helianthus annuus]|uniref:Uncharacterized protein n=1 Tax=Helianthus annuus TaxID=4232 RepID=A0A9K3P3X3_HELAN|nr:hypothetical protein HanXRQr2_Chr01g0014331 [Helianthus annuus]KAJ0956365.1 hypothetical protein HanPSC8_Chr01g0013911 [Helianthus annuus]